MDRMTLEAALIGYQTQAKAIEEKITAIRAQLGGKARGMVKTTAMATDDGTPQKKHKMSAAARKRIAAAQRARWRKFHAEQGK